MRKFPLYGITNDLKCQCGKADCKSPGKHPVIQQWKRDATDDPAKIAHWTAKYPGCNWAVLTGQGLVIDKPLTSQVSGFAQNEVCQEKQTPVIDKSQVLDFTRNEVCQEKFDKTLTSQKKLIVVDVDGDEGRESLTELMRSNNAEPFDTYQVLTGRGCHYYFTCQGSVKNSVSALSKHVDIKSDNGYVVAEGSMHVSGKRYEKELSSPDQPQPCPDWLMALLVPDTAKIEEGDRNTKIFKYGCSLRKREGLECDEIMAKLAEYNAARCIPPVAPGEVAAIAKSICRYDKGATIPSQSGGYKSGDFASVCALLRNPADKAKALGGEGELWYDTLRDLEMFGETIVSDVLALQMVDNIEQNFQTASVTRQVADAQGNVTAKTSQPRPIVFTKTMCSEAITMICHEKSRHPVAHWLRGLPAWDGVDRLSSVAEDLLGCTEPIEGVYLRKWFISAVARALQPGCQVDTALVLLGKQGLLKSSFFRVLAGQEFFSDSPCLVGTKDALSAAGSCWVYEWSELAQLSKSRNSDDVKAYLAAPVDRYRPAYGRKEVIKPRSCVIVGTTNEESFIGDDTGSRRFWVCQVPAKINLGQTRAICGQLWAEAVVAYDMQEPWWLNEEQESLRAKANDNHSVCNDDPWKELILTGLKDKTWVSARALLDLVCSDLEYATPKETRRIASICKQAGFEQARQTLGGIQTRGWSPVGKAPPELESVCVSLLRPTEDVPF